MVDWRTEREAWANALTGPDPHMLNVRSPKRGNRHIQPFGRTALEYDEQYAVPNHHRVSAALCDRIFRLSEDGANAAVIDMPHGANTACSAMMNYRDIDAVRQRQAGEQPQLAQNATLPARVKEYTSREAAAYTRFTGHAAARELPELMAALEASVQARLRVLYDITDEGWPRRVPLDIARNDVVGDYYCHTGTPVAQGEPVLVNPGTEHWQLRNDTLVVRQSGLPEAGRGLFRAVTRQRGRRRGPVLNAGVVGVMVGTLRTHHHVAVGGPNDEYTVSITDTDRTQGVVVDLRESILCFARYANDCRQWDGVYHDVCQGRFVSNVEVVEAPGPLLYMSVIDGAAIPEGGELFYTYGAEYWDA